MPYTFIAPYTAENLLYTDEYTNFGPNAITDVSNKGKMLTIDNTNNLNWIGTNGSNQLLLLDGSGLVASANLPSYVDNVLEFTNLASFPNPGAHGIIYVDLSTSFVYRWSGTVYVNIQSDYSYSKSADNALLALKSNIANPTFTGTVIAPTLTATTIQSTDGYTTEVIDNSGFLVTNTNALRIKHDVYGYASQEINGTGITITTANLPVNYSTGSATVTIPKLSSTTATITNLTAPTLTNTNQTITGTATIGTANITTAS
jgi:hypothetical protein